ncbi:hyccin [Plakobranchus ocellatus]|uniref:Hyccin n=1 Tax=Plakobranchus ocellatus TaxID=259542 RepID=A0AAV4B0S6_9GAST|nr:hyccin [Plakobranchus ocellatus]
MGGWGILHTVIVVCRALDIVHPDGSQNVESFRIPTVSRSSVYHESRIGGDSLTEHNLRQLNNCHGTFSILSHVMLIFNNDIDSVHSLSLEALCRVTSKLCNAGFVAGGQDAESGQSRIGLHSSLLIELLAGIYFAMFNGYSNAALKAIEAAHERASYELFSDVLLVTSGLLNYQKFNQLPSENLKGIHMRKRNSLVKNFITNASFKAKKLPDDIEMVDEEGQPVHGGSRLATVDEEVGGNNPLGMDYSMTKGLKARLKTKLGGDRIKSKESSLNQSCRRDSSDSTWNNSGRRDSELSGGGSLQQSPRWDGDGPASRRDRRGSDTPSLDSVGVAVKTLSLGQGDRGGTKVMVDMLEMETIKGNEENDEDNGDMYEFQNHFPQSQAQKRGLWSPPSTPSPTTAPLHSPLAGYGSKKILASAQSPATAAGVPSSQRDSKQRSSLSGSGVDPQTPDSPTSNGKSSGRSVTKNNNNNNNISTPMVGGNSGYTSSSVGSYSRTVSNSSRSSSSLRDRPDSSTPALGVSQSKTSPSLAASPSQSLEKSPSSVSSPPSSSYRSPRDAFFGISDSTKSLSQSGSNPAPNGSSSATSPSTTPTAHSPPAEQTAQAKAAVKINRNSYSTDL